VIIAGPKRWERLNKLASLVPVLERCSRANGAPEIDEAMLVPAAKSGDSQAFIELSTPYRSRLVGQVNRITKNWADTEDVVQDALLNAFIHLDNFDGRSSFSTWLTRIAINCALMRLRKKSLTSTALNCGPRTDEEPWQSWEPVDSRGTPEELFIKHEQEKLLHEAILRLSPRLREVIQLQQSGGSSLKEIAHRLGTSVGAAKSRLSRARRALRSSMLERDLSLNTGRKSIGRKSIA
jgi:RNA polymerase sigma factor (sigma-70 family)